MPRNPDTPSLAQPQDLQGCLQFAEPRCAYHGREGAPQWVLTGLWQLLCLRLPRDLRHGSRPEGWGVPWTSGPFTLLQEPASVARPRPPLTPAWGASPVPCGQSRTLRPQEARAGSCHEEGGPRLASAPGPPVPPCITSTLSATSSVHPGSSGSDVQTEFLRAEAPASMSPRGRSSPSFHGVPGELTWG